MQRDYSPSTGNSRHTSRSMMSSTASTWKPSKLPPHVDDVLHAKQRIELRPRLFKGQGLYTTQALLPGLERKLKTLPWEVETGQQKQSIDSNPDSTLQGSASRIRSGSGRRGRNRQPSADSLAPNKYQSLHKIISGDPFGKITFINSNDPMEVIPEWVTYRLEDSCCNARFALPSDYRELEDMTPLQYLEKYTVLTRGQRRRYEKIFTKYMDKTDKVIKHDKLYEALNSMFANSLGQANFNKLCTALFLPPRTPISSKALFAGLCTLTERLFWSSYIETNENTFFLLGPNRSLLECADFSGLQWKLNTLNISLEMRTLLFSLA